MIKPFSLQPLKNLAEHQNESATRKLGQLNRQQQDTQQKLDMLREYRKDYQNRLQEATQGGMDPAGLCNFQQFINKLDEAISQQIKAVEKSKISTQTGRDEFSITQRKLKSFDTLQQRHIEAQRAASGKYEQKMQDEHSSLSTARKMAEEQNR
ncbi:MAG TPA: flagellar export protein FliJ [Gallionella sp.]|jgi:flagellar FliJ protein|nr:flagellar export protein FliJ [Gallionella sp.]